MLRLAQLKEGYAWWRHVGHDCSRCLSLWMVWKVDIRPWILTPYYHLHMKWMGFRMRAMRKRWKKKWGIDI